mmetsp:Transcript_545/g.1122  ORF Transcript_545/g.1122 Transcript_545/m.1122 type:complete len:453 (-) Transcript_545:627-1985(-)
MTAEDPRPERKILVTQQNEIPPFCFQRVSLDKAAAPLLGRPIAPFDRTERKRAHTSALFYSECFLHGIEPKVADTAAVKAQGVYDKWWVKSTASSRRLDSIANDKSQSETQRSRNKGKHKKRAAEEAFLQSTNELASSLAARDSSLSKKVSIEVVKQLMIEELRSSGGDVHTPDFLKYQHILENEFMQHGIKELDQISQEGNWLTISKPTFTECKGINEKGENKYSLGRISFDMFKPTGLICSFQGSFNHVQAVDPNNPGRPLHVPRVLMQDIEKGNCRLRTYDIAVALTIEPGQDRKGNFIDGTESENYIVPKAIRAILTTQGYSIPDPNVANRLSIWFSGGSLEVQDEEKDVDEWKKIFDTSSAPNRDIREYANSLAARLLLGAHMHEKIEEDGTLRFDLKRPIGGHGSVFCDIIYMDDNLRIMHGHHDSVYVSVRVPGESITHKRSGEA